LNDCFGETLRSSTRPPKTAVATSRLVRLAVGDLPVQADREYLALPTDGTLDADTADPALAAVMGAHTELPPEGTAHLERVPR
jgi:hypothetical protein